MPAILLFFAPPISSQDRQPVFPSDISGWELAEEIQVFSGDELFDYINGGAEIYFEYGFSRVSVADYERSEDMVTVEVYEMTESGFGIFSLLRSENDAAVDIGNGCALSDYYLLFWSGHCLVAVTAQTEFEGSAGAVLDIARAVAAGLPAEGALPAILDLLPVENRLPGSEKYIVGPIGLQNVSVLASRLLAGYEEIAAARYGEKGGEADYVMICRWKDDVAAAGAMSDAREQAAGMTNTEVEKRNVTLLVSKEGSLALSAVQVGEFVIVALGPGGAYLHEVSNKIKRQG